MKKLLILALRFNMKTLKICLVILCLLPVQAVGTPQFCGANFFMKEIKLTKGKVALVDNSDYDYLSQFKWQALKGRKTYYAVRQKWVSGQKRSDCIYMHREILGLTNPKDFCDHEDGDGLNNQRYNIRKCNDRLNKFNSSAHKDALSKYKGVDYIKRISKWRARINKDKVAYNLGYFDSEIEAATVYNREAIKLHGTFARLNRL